MDLSGEETKNGEDGKAFHVEHAVAVGLVHNTRSEFSTKLILLPTTSSESELR